MLFSFHGLLVSHVPFPQRQSFGQYCVVSPLSQLLLLLQFTTQVPGHDPGGTFCPLLFLQINPASQFCVSHTAHKGRAKVVAKNHILTTIHAMICFPRKEIGENDFMRGRERQKVF